MVGDIPSMIGDIPWGVWVSLFPHETIQILAIFTPVILLCSTHIPIMRSLNLLLFKIIILSNYLYLLKPLICYHPVYSSITSETLITINPIFIYRKQTIYLTFTLCKVHYQQSF